MNKSLPDRRTAVLSLAATEAAGVIVPSELKGQTVMARTEQNANVESIRGGRGASIAQSMDGPDATRTGASPLEP